MYCSRRDPGADVFAVLLFDTGSQVGGDGFPELLQPDHAREQADAVCDHSSYDIVRSGGRGVYLRRWVARRAAILGSVVSGCVLGDHGAAHGRPAGGGYGQAVARGRKKRGGH